MKKKAEKILKYKDLTIEIQRMWNVQTEVIPVYNRGKGKRYRSIRKYLKQHTGKAQTIRRATYRKNTDNT
jgi:hypothetical protein